MYCPQCGQQQLSAEVRYCSRCGLPLGVVAEVLAGGGALQGYVAGGQGRGGKLTPRQRGMRQGAMLMLSAMLIVPLVLLLGVFLLRLPMELVPITAIFCVAGGFLRMIYASLFEEHVAASEQPAVPAYTPPTLAAPGGSVERGALPPQRQQGIPPPQPRVAAVPSRTNTAEIAAPPTSVTDHTTRLLDGPPDAEGR